MRALALASLAVALAAAPVLAQPPGATPPSGPVGPVAQPAGQTALSRAEKVKQQIRRQRNFELTNQLDLDEATAAKMVGVMGRFDTEFDRLLAQRADQQAKLSNAGQMKDAHAIEHLIDEAVTNQRAFWDVEDRRVAELRKVLTPQQAAKLLVVLPAIERRLQNQLQKAVHPGAGGPKNRRPNRQRPADDDDDDDR
jgi:Spy/CpxP family protein refolding chaperone